MSNEKVDLGQNSGIDIAQEAVDHARKQLVARGTGLGVRLGVRTSGCSGLAYHLEFVDEQGADDTVIEQDGVRFYVDGKSMAYLSGSRLQFAREGVNTGLRFENPNAINTCGCGESFNV